MNVLRVKTRIDYVLWMCRWRVLEDAGVQEERLHPLWTQRRDGPELSRLNWRAEQRRVDSMIVAAGCDERDGAAVLYTICVAVDLFV